MTRIRESLNAFQAFIRPREWWVGLIAGALTVVSIVATAVGYYLERPTRRRAAIFNAWQVVSSLENKGAEGGRAEALAELISHHESLAGVNLAGAILEKVDVSNTDMHKATLSNVEFTHCFLRSANLSGAILDRGWFIDGCDFTHATFNRTSIRGTLFSAAIMPTAQFRDTTADAGTKFDDVILKEAAVSNSHLAHVIFNNVDCTGARFNDTDLSLARFQNSVAVDWRWRAVTAPGVTLEKLNARGAHFEWETVLRESHFDQADLTRAHFDHVDLHDAILFGANLTHATFVDSDLSGADFTSALLTDARFIRCNIEDAIFTTDRQKHYERRNFIGCTGNPKIIALGGPQ